MAMKLHRGRTNVFQKKRPIRKIVLTIFLCILLVGGGVFMAHTLSSSAPNGPSGGGSSTAPSSGAPSSTTASTTTTTTTAPPPVATQERQAFYITVEKLKDPSSLSGLLKKAAAAGYNGVIFDLKDSDGVLHYVSETPLAAKAGAIGDTALSREALLTAAELCRDNGLEPIPQLYAFRDRTAPKKLKDARVKLKGNSSTLWLDRKKSAGGKPWLNPCAEEAQEYVLGLCAELKEWGFTVQMLNGVQFPEKDDRADYGDTALAALPKAEVLRRFVNRAETVMGKEGALWFMSPAAAALGTETDGYDGATVDFKADYAAVNLAADALGKSVTHGAETVKVASDYPSAVRLALAALQEKQGSDSTLIPQIPSDNKELLQAVKQAGYHSYILYNRNGTYTF